MRSILTSFVVDTWLKDASKRRSPSIPKYRRAHRGELKDYFFSDDLFDGVVAGGRGAGAGVEITRGTVVGAAFRA